jgi:serine/threonine protein kinase/tetratricopeptide (TPR) repeat protein
MTALLPARYEVTGTLGEGGVGRVFRAFDRTREYEVAIKIVGSTESEWLRREFDTLRQIRHENLIRVFDWSMLPDGSSYYSMEFIDGSDLDRLMGKPIPVERVRGILGGVLRGLAHLHSHGEIHGDLKPSNVLLTGGEIVKVSDVGMGREQSTAGGTPGFAAPEQWTGASPSEQSDIYAAGVIAYEALTGAHPFKGEAIREVVSGQLEGWVPSPSAHGVVVPVDLERAIMRALERDPQLRHGSADEFLEGIGLGNNPGEIVGGRFVNRLDELAKLEEFVDSDTPGSPTLLNLIGPRGIGKSAILGELRLRQHKAQFHDISNPERDLLKEPAGDGSDSREQSLSLVGDSLINRFGDARAVFIEDPGDSGKYLRSMARYVWAEASERSAASNVRFIRVVENLPSAAEPFEKSLELTAFELEAAEELINGLLGKNDLAKDTTQRILSESGGIPGAVEDLILDLVAQRLVARRFGRWQAPDIRESDWKSASTSATRWTRSLERLDNHQKDVLVAVALMPAGASTTALRTLFRDGDIGATTGVLQALGWLVPYGTGFRVVSREADRVVLTEVGSTRIDGLRSLMLERLRTTLSRPDRASLLLYRAATEEALQEGVWLGMHLRTKGQFSESISTFIRVRELARFLNRMDVARTASLEASEGYQRAGANDEVIAKLTDPLEWSDAVSEDKPALARARLLGLAYKAKGEINAAREYFLEYSWRAEKAGDQLQHLRAECELTEIIWRHGGGKGRSEAAERIRALIAHGNPTDENTDEWAGLLYQLGAILVVDGRRGDAIPILQGAMKQARSRYWQMRISNALAAAHYYLGTFGAGLAAADEAWQSAVEGGVDSFKPRLLASRAGLRSGLGRFREASEQNLLSAYWGRRIGSPFEFEAGLLGTSSNLNHLGEYEKAIRFAAQAREVAALIPSPRDVSRSYEIESFALIQIGDFVAAEKSLRDARDSLDEGEFSDLIPRLYWHEARIEMERDGFEKAESKLADALEILVRTQDWEDLPSVRIELQRLFARTGDKRLNLSELQNIIDTARSSEMALVQLRGTLALAEIVSLLRTHAMGQHDILMEGLRLAERSGANEYVWRLSYWIARNLSSANEKRGASSRLNNAIRVIREVAAALTPEHRAVYLDTPHARLLMAAAGVAVTGSDQR